MASGITHLIVNSPYDEPKHHWHYHRDTLTFPNPQGRETATGANRNPCSRHLHPWTGCAAAQPKYPLPASQTAKNIIPRTEPFDATFDDRQMRIYQ